LAVLRQQKPIDDLSNDELEAVLLYHGVQKSKMGRQSERKEKWRKILEEEGKLPFRPRWTDEDETKPQAYKDKPIEMGDTSYGRYVENMKKTTRRSTPRCPPRSERSSRPRSARSTSGMPKTTKVGMIESCPPAVMRCKLM